MLKKASLLGFAICCCLNANAQRQCAFTLTGIITSTEGEALSGATVVLDSGATATITDAHGHYRFQKLCSRTYAVRVQFVGFEPMQTKIAIAQNATHDFALKADVSMLQEVVVRAHQPLTEHVNNVAILNARQLLQQAGKSLGETLKEIPGVNTIQAGPGIFKPVIHGVHSQRILILNHGIRHEGQQWGAEHAPEIDPFVASSLVVIKDANAIKYGTDALGGVILINPPDLPEKAGLSGKLVSVAQSNGRVATLSGSLEGGIKSHEGWGWRVQGTAKSAGDFHAADYSLTNTGLREYNFSGAVGLHKESFGVEVFYSRFQTELGILRGTATSSIEDLAIAMERDVPNFTTSFSRSVSEPRQAVVHNLVKLNAHTERGNSEYRLQYGFQSNARQEFDLRKGALAKTPALDLQLQTHTLEAEWEHEDDSGRTLCLGVNAMAQDNVNIFGTMQVPFIPNFVNYSGGVFAVGQKIIQQWKLDLGVRYDYRFYRVKGFDYKNVFYQDNLHFGNVSATAGATWRMPSGNRWDFNISTAWRPLHVAELYSSGVHQSAVGIEYGLLLDAETNEVQPFSGADVRPEQALKFISTYQWEREKVHFFLTGYANRIGNYVYLKPSGITENVRGALPFFRYAQTHVLMVGADVSFAVDFSPTWKGTATAALLRAKNLTSTGELPFIVPNRFDVGLRWAQRADSKYSLYAETKLRYVARQHFQPRIITPRQFLEASKQGVDLLENDNRNLDFAPAPDGYFLVSASAGGALKIGQKRLEMGFSVTNALDASYREYTNRFRYFADDLGRNFSISIQYHF